MVFISLALFLQSCFGLTEPLAKFQYRTTTHFVFQLLVAPPSPCLCTLSSTSLHPAYIFVNNPFTDKPCSKHFTVSGYLFSVRILIDTWG